MAAAFCQSLGERLVQVRSAGSAPATVVNPVVIEAMREVGIDLDAQPQRLSDEAVLEADVVITMGCGDACPVYPDKRYEDWVVDDPAGQSLEVVRGVRDELRQRVAGLLSELGLITR